jgi:hypothetical protein
MNYNELSDVELLQMFSSLHDIEANNEWYRRYGINLPYRLDIFGRVVNCMSLYVLPDFACDKLIRKQANEVRLIKQLSSY